MHNKNLFAIKYLMKIWRCETFLRNCANKILINISTSKQEAIVFSIFDELYLKTNCLCSLILTLNGPCISESCIEIKIKVNVYFDTSLWCLKRFMKPFEAPQRSAKIKIQLNFFSSSGIGTGRVKFTCEFFTNNIPLPELKCCYLQPLS